MGYILRICKGDPWIRYGFGAAAAESQGQGLTLKNK